MTEPRLLTVDHHLYHLTDPARPTGDANTVRTKCGRTVGAHYIDTMMQAWAGIDPARAEKHAHERATRGYEAWEYRLCQRCGPPFDFKAACERNALEAAIIEHHRQEREAAQRAWWHNAGQARLAIAQVLLSIFAAYGVELERRTGMVAGSFYDGLFERDGIVCKVTLQLAVVSTCPTTSASTPEARS